MSGGYSIRGVIVRVLILLVLIAMLVFLGFFLASRAGFFQMGGAFAGISRSIGLGPTDNASSIGDPQLIEYDRQRAEQQRLAAWEAVLKQQELQIADNQALLDRRTTELDAKEKELFSKEENIRKAVQLYENIGGGLRTTAESLTNMPPDKAIEILLNMEDPNVISVLNMVNSIAKERNEVSLVPVWLQMMPPARSAAIIRKMSVT
ncbi:MAG: periplasmic-type flagellar collar protein FlbB [Spirochaetia bacterium]